MTSSLGIIGESYAAAYLEQLGYRLVAANFTLPVGRNRRGAIINAEIDLIAYDGDTLCFIEVKSRSSDWFASPQVNVDLRKRRQITRAARVYRQMLGIKDQPYRYDVVTIILADNSSPQIELLRNFWTDESVRKKRWVVNFYE
jgi:putative endonuclease